MRRKNSGDKGGEEWVSFRQFCGTPIPDSTAGSIADSRGWIPDSKYIGLRSAMNNNNNNILSALFYERN